MTIIDLSYDLLFSNSDFRLSFGVPLEDVFRNGELHPSLKRLFVALYQSFGVLANYNSYVRTGENHPLECLNDKREINFQLIDALTYNKPLPLAMPFEVLLDALRYFLQCLPLPLLPKYTNKQTFNWRNVARHCKTAIENRLCNERINNIVIQIFTNELLRLPRVNLLLIGYFVNFLRSIIWWRKRFSKKCAVILVNYFASSVLHSSCTEKCQVYHPLLLFLLVQWPRIQNLCIKTIPECFKPIPVYAPSDFILQQNISTHRNIQTVSTYRPKTTARKSLSTIEEVEECAITINGYLNRKKSIACQTDLIKNNVYSQTSSLRLSNSYPQVNEEIARRETVSKSTITQSGLMMAEPLEPEILYSADANYNTNTQPIYDSIWELLSGSSSSVRTKTPENKLTSQENESKQKTNEIQLSIPVKEDEQCNSKEGNRSTSLLNISSPSMNESTRRTRSLIHLIKKQSAKIRTSFEFIKRMRNDVLDRARSEEFLLKRRGIKYKKMGTFSSNGKEFNTI